MNLTEMINYSLHLGEEIVAEELEIQDAEITVNGENNGDIVM
jgi:hypothetical protein